MDKSIETGPQYPANEGSKISGDPASVVTEQGGAGGHATCDLQSAMRNQVAAECGATGTSSGGSPVEHLSQQVSTIGLRKQPSGAQRRKLRRLKHLAGGPQESRGAQTKEVMPVAHSSGHHQPAGGGGAWQTTAKTHPASGSASKQAKRPLQHGDTPASLKPAAKRPRQLPSYKAAVASSLQVAIVDRKNVGGMTTEQMEALTERLTQALDRLPSTSLAPPRFHSSGLTRGGFVLACADQQTLDWLKKTVSSLGSVWEGADLQVIPKSDLPRHKVFTVFIPGQVDRDTVFARLQRQNPCLRTDLWRVHKQEVRGEQTFLALGVDETSVQTLKDLDCRPYYQLGRVTFLAHTKLE